MPYGSDGGRGFGDLPGLAGQHGEGLGTQGTSDLLGGEVESRHR